MNSVIYKQKKQSEYVHLHLLLSIFLVFWMNGGLLTFANGFPGFRYIKLILLFLWGMVALSRDSMFFSRFLKISTPLLFFLVFVFLEKLFGVSEFKKYADMTINNAYFILIITALFAFYINSPNQKEKRVILYAWLVDIIICGIITLRTLEAEPMLSRILATADPSEYMGRNVLPKGILSYGNAHSFAFCIVALCTYLKKEYGIKRIIVVAMMAFMFFLILEMQFAISFFMMILAIVISWCVKRFQNGTGSLLIVLSPLAFLLIYLFSEQILGFFIKLAGDNFELISRLNEVRYFLLGHSLTGTDLNSRFNRYANSFEAIFSNYFMGALIIGKGKIGGHSELLDCFAVYGILPFLCLIWYFKSLYKEIKKSLDKFHQPFMKLVFFLLFILSIVNTSLWSPMMLVFILIVPLMLLNLSDKNGKY